MWHLWHDWFFDQSRRMAGFQSILWHIFWNVVNFVATTALKWHMVIIFESKCSENVLKFLTKITKIHWKCFQTIFLTKHLLPQIIKPHLNLYRTTLKFRILSGKCSLVTAYGSAYADQPSTHFLTSFFYKILYQLYGMKKRGK